MRAAPTLPTADDPTMRAVLRDGSVTDLRVAGPEDHEAVRRFFHELSPESRRRRFFSIAEPPDPIIARLCDASDPAAGVTLLAIRNVDGELKPIAMGSYLTTGDAVAEVAFAVDDHFQGKGLGTILLERLATIAAQHGIDRFEAVTLPENAAMIEVFIESGFEVRSRSESGAVSVQLSIQPTEEAVTLAERRLAGATASSLRPLLEPSAVAVVGASRDPASIGHRILTALVSNRFNGAIYPINPKTDKVAGLQCYPSLTDAPRGIDLAIVAVPREFVLDVVDQCAAVGVRSLVVITAGFAETGNEGRALQQQLVAKVRAYGMRMVGPNCMGVLNANPSVRMNGSFSPVVPPAGRVALSSQSGALGLAILELAAEREVGLSTFVSVGNKADVSGNDLLQVLGGGSDHRGHPAVPRIVRQPASLRAAGPTHRSHQTDRVREVGTNEGWFACGRQPHGSACRQRYRRRCTVPAVRRDPGRDDRRDVRHRDLPRHAAVAGGETRRGCHECGRSRDPGRRRVRIGRPERAGVFPGDARAVVEVFAARGQHWQSGRHDRVGRTGRVPARDRGRPHERRCRRAHRYLYAGRSHENRRDRGRRTRRHPGRPPWGAAETGPGLRHGRRRTAETDCRRHRTGASLCVSRKRSARAREDDDVRRMARESAGPRVGVRRYAHRGRAGSLSEGGRGARRRLAHDGRNAHRARRRVAAAVTRHAGPFARRGGGHCARHRFPGRGQACFAHDHAQKRCWRRQTEPC